MHNAKQKQQVPEQKSVIKKFQGLLSESWNNRYKYAIIKIGSV